MPVAEKLVRMVGRIPRRGPIPAGKGRLDINLPRWNVPSNRQPFLVLRDWDSNDGVACVPALLDKLRGEAAGSPGLAVRIAVRSVESWLLADSEAFSTFFRVRRDLLPTEPDEIADPKGVVLQLCSRSPSNIRRGCCQDQARADVSVPSTQPSSSSLGDNIGIRREPGGTRESQPIDCAT